MTVTIDCLFIGHNEMKFSEYESSIRKMGTHSGAYRDLNLNYIQYNNQPYTASEIFNLFYCSTTGPVTPGRDPQETRKPFQVTETFNAATAYLGTYLHKRGYTFDYVNSFQEEKGALKEKLQKENILSVAIVTTLYVAVLPILEIMQYIRKYNAGARIIVGGPFIATRVRTRDPATLDYTFRSIGADYYVNSPQGEAALTAIIKAIKENTNPALIDNIYYKEGDTYKPTETLMENNRLAENMVDWKLYTHRVGEYINVRTAISCPFSCAFCGFPQHAGEYQTAPVEAIEKELDEIEAIGTVKSLHFIDDTFNVPKKRFREILEMMIKKKYRFKWYSHYRCQFADEDTVRLMKESGCEGVFLGIESGSDEILGKMRKAAAVNEYYRGVSLLKEAGILTYGSFIIGFPGETEETVKETRRFIRESGIDYYRAQLWYCEPLTPIWRERETYDLKGESFEWSHATMNSGRAADIVEDIFLNLQGPTWVPQYNFECDALFHLMHRGMTRERMKTFLNAFNKGIGDRLKSNTQKEAGFEIIRQIKDSCTMTMEKEEPVAAKKSTKPALDADFDF